MYIMCIHVSFLKSVYSGVNIIDFEGLFPFTEMNFANDNNI